MEITNIGGGTEAYNLYTVSNANYSKNTTFTGTLNGAAIVLTAAQLVGVHGVGSVLSGNPGVNTTWTLPIGAGIVTAIPNIKVGSTFKFTIVNNAVAGSRNAITVTAGADSTLVDTGRGGNFILEESKNTVMTYLGVITDAATGAHNVYPLTNSVIDDLTVASAPGAGAAQTLTAAMLIGGVVIDDPEVVTTTWTLDTAAAVVAALPNCIVGTSLDFTVINQGTAGAGDRIVLAAGAGGAFVGSIETNELTLVEGINPTGRFRLVVTNVGAPAYEFYPLTSVTNTSIDLKPEMGAITAGLDGAGPAITAAMLLGGVLFGNPGGAAAWTLPDAVDVVLAIPNCKIGTTFLFTCMNNAVNGTVQAITVTAGANVTLTDVPTGGNFVLTEGTNEIMTYRVIVTAIAGAGAYTVIPMTSSL